MKRGSLTVVGTGIKALAHMTAEASSVIRAADKVLYGTCEQLTERWIKDNAKAAESIDSFYTDGALRSHAYRDMIDKILNEVRSGQNVCLSLEGHPGIFVHISHESIRLARQEGYAARMLPGISTQSVMFCDLLIDPALYGCQSFDATDFLLRGYKPDRTSMLVLWQVGCVGDLRYRRDGFANENLPVLIEVLEKFYDRAHEVLIYLAPLFVISAPKITRTTIRGLASHDLNLATLCVPPLREFT